MPPRRVALAPLQAGMFDAPLPAGANRDQFAGRRVAFSAPPAAPQPLPLSPGPAKKQQRKRTEAAPAVWCDETAITFVQEEKAFQDKFAGKQTHTTVRSKSY